MRLNVARATACVWCWADCGIYLVIEKQQATYIAVRLHTVQPVELSFCAWATYGRPISCFSVYLSYYNASISRWLMRLLVQATMDRTSSHANICFYLTARPHCRHAVRDSLRPSRSGIASRRMKMRSCGFQLLERQSF